MKEAVPTSFTARAARPSRAREGFDDEMDEPMRFNTLSVIARLDRATQ